MTRASPSRDTGTSRVTPRPIAVRTHSRRRPRPLIPIWRRGCGPAVPKAAAVRLVADYTLGSTTQRGIIGDLSGSLHRAQECPAPPAPEFFGPQLP